MPVLTQNAASIIRQLVETSELPEGAGLRITTTDGDGQTLTVSPASTPEAGDEVVEDGGALVFLEAGAVAALEDRVLDASVSTDGKVKFRLASP